MPMRAALNKFINIFRIELEDLEEDINDLLEILEQRRESHEITNYVYIGNKGILLNQISCVQELLESLRSIDAYQYESVETMIADLKKKIEKRIKDCAFPEAVHSMVQRKFEKVCAYVTGPQ